MSNSAVTVLVVDDRDIVRSGLKIALAGDDSVKIIGEAGSGHAAIKLCEELQPDVVLMDLIMPEMDGLEATRLICQANPEAKVIILTSFENDSSVQDVLLSGARGYIAKNLLINELVDAIHCAKRGETIVSQVFVDNLKAADSKPASANS